MSSLYEANEIIPIIIVTPTSAMARNTSMPTLAASTKENNVSSMVKALDVIAYSVSSFLILFKLES